MSVRKILTIAIPAYNRIETLEKLIVQLQSEPDQNFDLLISDDDSPNGEYIQSMVKKYQDVMPNLFFYKNDKNLGFSSNVLKLYGIAETRYIWFICDDDDILPGAVNKVNQALSRYKPTVAVFNHSWINPYGVKLVAGPSKDIIYNSVDQLSDYQPIMRTTFLSTLVLDRSFSIDKAKLTDYENNVFVQVTLSLLLLSCNFRFCEISSVIIHRNVGFNYGDFYKFYLVDELKAIFSVNHKFDNRIFVKWKKKRILEALLLYLSQKLGLFKYHESPTPETWNKVGYFYGNLKYLIYVFRFIFFITPSVLLKCVYFLQLFYFHGFRKAILIYKKNINRAFKDKRGSGFVSYR